MLSSGTTANTAAKRKNAGRKKPAGRRRKRNAGEETMRKKWYKKALISLIIVVFSPLLLIALIIYGFAAWFKSPALKKEYKKSRYYSDVKRKYNLSVTSSPEYRFYNSAVKRELPIEYHKQDSNGLTTISFGIWSSGGSGSRKRSMNGHIWKRI